VCETNSSLTKHKKKVVTPSREEREKHGAQIKEYILEDTACPLAILIKQPANAGQIIFQIRRCTPDILALRKQKKKELEKQQQQQQQHLKQLQTIQSQPTLLNQANPHPAKRQNQQQAPHPLLQANQATQSMHNFNHNFNQPSNKMDFVDNTQ
jgi:hypothetical protein